MVKFNMMAGISGVIKMENNIDALLAGEKDLLAEFVESSLAFKKALIEEDEFDRGARIHLNFAHTFGHAFETVSNYRIPHGTAVAMGMIVADRISLARGWLTEDIVTRAEDVLWKIIHVDPEDISMDMDRMMDAIRKDKKQTGKELTAVLMRDDMETVIVHDVKGEEIREAVSDLAQRLIVEK